ncbi:CHAD domain-containing protein [Marinobacter sp. ANT_B65]|uniref:CHAD domain-containing protein n=1 Tax=Marinobacter sp. ANT_B65 TaxID=2039467 RepID=UPI000BBF1DF6|nr:CHAD domain-containing protein [Marinobacter sp. ANT_B65]PCM45810.1 metal-chelation protein CHAD [Marinobacter sp. ANT_B65]
MRYRLSVEGSLKKHLRRLVCSINDDIALALLLACRDPERGVHEARKSCKEMRAVLRLIRPWLGEAEFRYWQDFYRSFSGKLSGNRDAMVRVQTWKSLVAEFPRLQGKAFAGVASFLSAQQPDSADERGRDFYLELALEIGKQSEVPQTWNLPKSLSDLLPNLKTIYRDACEAGKTAKRSNNTDSFHRFRKRSKDLFYCLRVLKPVIDTNLTSMVAGLQEMSEIQGNANDQAVLLAYLREHRKSLGLDDSDWKLVQNRITKKRSELRRQAHKMAKKHLMKSPGVFIKSL